MEKFDILSQMEKYDFNTPINVKLILDESDDEDSSRTILEEQMQVTNTCNTIEEYTLQMGEHIKVGRTEKQTPINGLNDYSCIIENPPTNQNAALLKDLETVNNDNGLHEITLQTHNNVSEICQQSNDKNELSSYVKDLLKTLSLHLTILMSIHYKSFKTFKTAELSAHFKQVKAHFFGLSYSTVVSLLLPQEKNLKFINTFIDRIVYDAEKALQRKCERHEVIPFYNELIEWAKKKQEQIKALQKTNENSVLKKQLASPLLNYSNAPILPYNRQISGSENSQCIFSYGAPGREIRIDIDSDISINRHIQQIQHSSRTKEAPANKKKLIDNKSCRLKSNSVPRQTPCKDAQAPHLPNNHQYNYTYHQPVHLLPPPPSYYDHQLNTNSGMGREQFRSVTNQYQENTAHYQQHYQAQRNANHSQSAMFNTGQRPGPNFGANNNVRINRPTMPKTTTAPPSNLVVYITNGRCYVCGKITNTICSKCHKFFYCSYLCQELHEGVEKGACRKQ